MRRVAMLLCVFLLLPSMALAQAKDPVKLKVGMVAAVDMLALPIAVERGFFEKYGLDVTIARPYATGVDALNALQAGETDMVQAGVPAIGAILRGMDLVFFGNFSGNATKLGSDATLALIANGGSGIVKGDLKSLKGKKIATSFGTINHLYILGLLEKGRTWVKLSGAYSNSKIGPPDYPEATKVALAFVKAAPERLVWGSDWPHPTSPESNKPDDALLLDLLTVWVPNEAMRNRVLVANPETLYGFPKST